ncbi:MAG: PEP/pyruvate-binding domain-containing protein [Dehalococcoidia bacterium]
MMIDLDEEAALDPSRCGTKAATLAQLRRLEVAVPPGVILPIDVLVSVDAHTLAEAVFVASRRWGGGPLAVRSSAVGEDGRTASFAGLFTTVLGAEGVAEIELAIRRCLDAAAAAPVQAYRGGRPPQMAILVQPLLAPIAAGVVFTADPVTGDLGTSRVSAVVGLGDRLVAGTVNPDEWDVRDGKATRRPEAGNEAIDAQMAERIAAVANDLSSHLGGPLDVEWALVADDIVVLQARPITALPTPPVFPEGDGWEKDLAHFPEAVSAFGGDLVARTTDEVMADTATHFGLLIDGFETRVVGGEVYSRPVASGGGGKAPPAIVVGVMARLLPALRREMSAAGRIVEGGLLEGYPRRWEDEWRPQLTAAIDRLMDVDLAGLDDIDLAAHGDELERFYAEGVRIHFRLMVPYFVALWEWTVAAEELLGWDVAQAMAALAGDSPASARGGRDLAALRLSVDATIGAREALEARPGSPVEALRAIDGDLADEMTAWIRRHGWRTANYDPGSLTLSERPGLLTRLLLSDPAQESASADGNVLGQARAALSVPDRARVDATLVFARLCYPQREDNIVLTDSLPSGLLRRWLLDAAQRLLIGGRIERVDDAPFLLIDEIRDALRGGEADLHSLVARRRGEWAWARLHPGPDRLGSSGGAPPDISRLPAAGRRINSALLWAMGHEFPAGPLGDATGGSAFSGAAGSPGRYRGPVRIVRGEADFVRLQPGDVLVCPVTTPAWAVLFPLAGALVTDGGGVLSHAAIVAREHGIPAVLGTGRATRDLADGTIVEVDGTAGTVSIVR